MNIVMAVLIALSPAPPTPDIPPPLPTYVVTPGGGKMLCTPGYEFCWPENPYYAR
jgi:hypothetical protein